MIFRGDTLAGLIKHNTDVYSLPQDLSDLKLKDFIGRLCPNMKVKGPLSMLLT